MHWTRLRRRSLLSRDRPLPGELEDVFGMDTDRGPGRAGAHAGRPAPQARAAVAFHRGLGDFLLRPAAEPAQQARLGSDLGELDHPVRTVLDTISATDAG